MTIEPESHEAKILDNGRRTLADCLTFRAVVGAADRESAEAFIHGEYAVDDDTEEGEEYPRAVLYFDNMSTADLVGTTTYNEKETLLLLLELVPPEEVTSRWEQMVWFFNQVGKIRKELQKLGTEDPGAGPYLNITGLNRRGVGKQDPKKNNGRNVWGAEYEVMWEGGSV